MENANLTAIFFTGLIAGGLSCMAVQGGLLAATIAQRQELSLEEKAKKTGNTFPILSFIVAKLVAYTILGFLLGWFGSLFKLSLTAQVIMQIAVVVFMVGTAFNLLNVHPIFRYFVIQPPKFITRKIRSKSKSRDIFAPAFLGFLTVLIPCGITQGAMVAAIGTQNPLYGAAVMFAFTLGTSPLFFTLGYFATKLGEVMHARFMKLAAVTLLLLAVYNLHNALALSGVSITVGSAEAVEQTTTQAAEPIREGVTEATIYIHSKGYEPKNITLKSGSAVKINLVNTDGTGCAQAFTVPSMRIQKIVPVGKTDTVTFTTPAMSGQIAFMCSMGMYRGVINVN